MALPPLPDDDSASLVYYYHHYYYYYYYHYYYPHHHHYYHYYDCDYAKAHGVEHATDDLQQPPRQAALELLVKRIKKIDKAYYERGMKAVETYTVGGADDVSSLEKALAMCVHAEQAFTTSLRRLGSTFATTTTQELDAQELNFEELGWMGYLVEAIAQICRDKGDASNAARYYERLKGYDYCRTKPSYQMCTNYLYMNLIVLYRNQLQRPDLARTIYDEAVSLTHAGQRVLKWKNEWQLVPHIRPEIRSLPFWDAPETDLPQREFLEEHAATFKRDLLAFLAHPEFGKSFSQGDYHLINTGSWGEHHIFQNRKWSPACEKVIHHTCQLLSQRPELIGRVPGYPGNEREPDTNEIGYYALGPGAKLNPHVGLVNTRIFCQVGLVVPEGSYLRVGAGVPRAWAKEGQVMCFEDSFEHAAWNNGTEVRYVLLTSPYHPDLGKPEFSSKVPMPKKQTEEL